MKQIFVGYFLIIMLFHNIHGMVPSSTPESRQKERNQLAFAYACEKNQLNNSRDLFTDGSTDLNYLYKDVQDIERTQLSIATRKYTYPVITASDYNPDVIKWFLDNKANPNITDASGRIAILWAVSSYQGRDKPPVKLFLDRGLVDINQVYTITNIGDFFQIYYQPKVTLLIAAVLNNWEVFDFPQARYNLVRALLEFKPDRNLAPNGQTALQIAESLHDQEMIKILKEK